MRRTSYQTADYVDVLLLTSFTDEGPLAPPAYPFNGEGLIGFPGFYQVLLAHRLPRYF